MTELEKLTLFRGLTDIATRIGRIEGAVLALENRPYTMLSEVQDTLDHITEACGEQYDSLIEAIYCIPDFAGDESAETDDIPWRKYYRQEYNKLCDEDYERLFGVGYEMDAADKDYLGGLTDYDGYVDPMDL